MPLLAALVVLLALLLPGVASASPAPLHSCAHPTEPHWIYTQADCPTGYVAKPLAGYIETENTGRPLMRLYKGDLRHYSDDPAERAAMIADGWTENARVGYLQPAGTPMTAPTYRLTWPADQYQVLTTDQVERDRMIAEGWSWDGTLGNLTNQLCVPDDTHKSLTYDPPTVTADWENLSFAGFYKLYAAACDAAHGIQFVTSPRHEGDYAGRFALSGSGDTTVAHGDRSEFILNQPQTRGYEGGEAWFGWSTLFTDEFQMNETNLGTGGAKGSVLVANVHQTNAANADCASPDGLHNVGGAIWQLIVDAKTNPVTFRSQLRGGNLTGVIDGGGVCQLETYDQANFGPFTRNQWHDFVLHVKWSLDTTKGLLELWHNGVKVQEVHGATLMDDQYGYWKQGVYRPADWDQPSAVYHDGFRRGESYAEVAP